MSKHSLICMQKSTWTFHTITEILSKVMIHVKSAKNKESMSLNE